MTERYSVPTHLDVPDGIGSYTLRQGMVLIGGITWASAMLMSTPQVGPALGDLGRVLLPTLGQAIPPGALPSAPIGAAAVPLAIAAALALPLEPPPEHGAVSWVKFRTQPRMLGPQLIDDLVGYCTVERDMARMYGGFVAGWQMPSVSMRLASDDARSAERARWAAFLDSAPCPVQTTVRARPVDLQAAFGAMSRSSNPNGPRIANYLRAAASAGGEVQRQRLLWIRASTDDQLDRWAQDIGGALRRAGLLAERLGGEDLADALHTGWTRKKRQGDRIGPSMIRVESDGLQIDGEWLSVLALQRWPASIPIDFMASLYDGSDPIDVHQLIWPLETVKVRKHLESLHFKLSTTKATRERSVALEQLDTTLNALTRNMERVYETEILFAVRAPSREALQARRRRVETICAEMGAEATPMKWEHQEAAVACSGALENRLVKRTHRVDSSSISRAFPWGASELGLEGGVPWGKTLYGNRRVVWSPFARPIVPNPQTAVYGGSGAGKGFAVKVVTSRGLLAGMFQECFFLDQAEESEDGEYGRWARYCGGEVRYVRRATWEQDLAYALADVPRGTLPPAIVLNIADLNRFERARAMVAFKRAVWLRAAAHEANRAFGIDEMWSFEGDKEAEDEVEDLVRRGRHVHLAGFYMTQRVLDALNSKMGQTVQAIAKTHWYGVQGDSELTDVKNRLRWTNEQVQAIERFTAGQAMLVAGRDRLLFYVDYSPEEYDAFHTDYIEQKRSPDARRHDHVPALDGPSASGADGDRAHRDTGRLETALATSQRLNGAG